MGARWARGRAATTYSGATTARVGHAQPLLRQLHQPLLDVRVLGDVKGRLAGARYRADVRPVLSQDLDGLQVTPAGGRMQGLPEVMVGDLSGDVVVQQELQDLQVAVGGRYVERRCPVLVSVN